MKNYRIGIVGVGGICVAAHIPALKEMKNVTVVALCDLVESKMDTGDTALGYKTQHFTDYNELLRLDLDAIHICLPNYLHSVVAIAALKAKKNVFCEKPDAVSIEEVEKMYSAYKASGKTLMIMRNNRHNPATKLALEMLKGSGNNFYAGRCGWVRRRGIPGKGGWFTTKSLSGGGPLIDLGVHMIDLAIYLMGNPTPVSVSGCTFNKFSDSNASDSVHSSFGERVSGGTFDVEDLAMGFIRFDNGACLQVECSWASNVKAEHQFVELRGDKAGISINNGALEMYTEVAGQMVDTTAPAGGFVGHGRNIEHFYDVLGGAEPDFLPIQGVNMIKILSAMYESAVSGHEVIIK